MTPDLYTKFVLSVIAAALLWLCFRQSQKPATWPQEPIRVSIRDVELEDKTIPVRIILKQPHAGNYRDELGDQNPLPVATMR
jgi:hypothetical protein